MNNITKTALVMVGLLGIRRLFAKENASGFSIINGQGIRGCDPFGCGYFGASRGNHVHEGVDLKVTPGQDIKAPFDCKIVRYGFPYAGVFNYHLVEIQGLGSLSDFKAKIMYIKKIHDVGKVLARGETICNADDISQKYDSTMTPHVHFELRKNGKLIDPTKFFKQ